MATWSQTCVQPPGWVRKYPAVPGNRMARYSFHALPRIEAPLVIRILSCPSHPVRVAVRALSGSMPGANAREPVPAGWRARRRLGAMRQEWHQIRNPGLEIGRPVTDAPESDYLGLDSWRALPRAQMPPWEDLGEVAQVCGVLNTVP